MTKLYTLIRNGSGYSIVSVETDGVTVDQTTVKISEPDILAIQVSKLQRMVQESVQ